MKTAWMFMVLALFCGASFASVAMETEHYDDACTVSLVLATQGYNPVVQISTVRGAGTSYYILYRNDWYNPDYDLEKMYAGIFAAAVVSEQTSWTSSQVFVCFEDKTFVMPTINARTLYNYINSTGDADADAVSYFLTHVTIMDQGLSDL